MNLRCLALLALIAAASCMPLGAHHAFAAEFDEKNTVLLKGEVTKLEWENPHIWIYLEVKGENGAIEKWQCEGGAPNSLFRNGWTRNSLKPGDQVTVDGFRAKDSSKTCNAKTVKLPDGRSIFAGSSAPSAQKDY